MAAQTVSATNQRRAKRSANVRLTTMAVAASSIMVSACGDGPAVPSAQAAGGPKAGHKEVQVFSNVFDCKAKSKLSEDECRDAHSLAAKAAEKEAPRFEALSDCEEEWGQGKCVEQKNESTRRAHFSPFLTGYFLAKTLGDNGKGRATPLFSKSDGAYQTGNGMRLGYAGAPGKYYASARAAEQPKQVQKTKAASAAAASISRSGFGSRAAGGWTVGSRDGGDDGRSGRASSRGG